MIIAYITECSEMIIIAYKIILTYLGIMGGLILTVLLMTVGYNLYKLNRKEIKR